MSRCHGNNGATQGNAAQRWNNEEIIQAGTCWGDYTLSGAMIHHVQTIIRENLVVYPR